MTSRYHHPRYFGAFHGLVINAFVGPWLGLAARAALALASRPWMWLAARKPFGFPCAAAAARPAARPLAD
jgi:hypothetical protein